MFDIGWPEMLVVAVVLIVVVGPKDLPRMLRTFGKTTSSLRRMAGDFRKQFDEALKEAELDDVKSTIDSARKLNPAADIRKALNPMEKAASDVKAGLDGVMKPKPADIPAPDAPARAAEPAKGGATAGPGSKAAGGPAENTAAKPAADKPAATDAAKPSAASTAKPAKKAATVSQASAKASAAKPPAKSSSGGGKAASGKKPAARKPAAGKTTGASS